MKQDFILCHYGEIALKGKNRDYFEKRLIENIKDRLEVFAPGSFEYVKNIYGGILIRLNGNGVGNKDQVADALKHTFGITNFSFAAGVKQDLEKIKAACLEMVSPPAGGEKFETFRVTTQRSNKQFALGSMEIDRAVGGHIFENFGREKKVRLKNPDLEVLITIVSDLALVSLKKTPGPGGLPVGTGGRAMTLISGGFDSPVAAWHLIKRGTAVSFAHFHSMPYTSKASVEKVTDLVKALKRYGASGTVYLIPFADAQKEIVMKCKESLRVILYRRLMLRIAEALAEKEKALALVTGDSVGQVASQTLENIFAVNQAATIPVFRPLIGLDKEEIMQKAREIGTYDISKLPHDDCCTRLMPKSPETRAKLADVLAAEKNLDIEKLVRETLLLVEKISVD